MEIVARMMGREAHQVHHTGRSIARCALAAGSVRERLVRLTERKESAWPPPRRTSRTSPRRPRASS